jgi:broad specificity phosphatase PhoE
MSTTDARPFAQQVVFIRHGESKNNTLWVDLGGDRAAWDRQRYADAPLTDRGALQADVVAARIAKEYAAASLILTSYMHRALRTADAVQQALQRDAGNRCPVRVHRDLHEFGGHHVMDDAGAKVGTPGRTAGDVVAEFPAFAVDAADGCEDGWWKSAGEELPEGGMVRGRALVALLAAEAAAGNAGPVVVITHADFFRYCMKALEDCGAVPVAAERYALTNTSVTLLELAGRVADGAVAWDVGAIPVCNCAAHTADIGVLPMGVAQPVQTA